MAAPILAPALSFPKNIPGHASGHGSLLGQVDQPFFGIIRSQGHRVALVDQLVVGFVGIPFGLFTRPVETLPFIGKLLLR